MGKGLAALAVLLAFAAPAQAARVSVLVVPPFDPATYARRGAIGLFVPGSGETVSRRGALASLLRGKVEPAVLGRSPSGAPLIELGRAPAATTIYLALPPPGTHSNTKRYPIAIVGGGYHGILVSGSTRIRGLVSIADIAPTAVALEQGRRPTIRPRADADPAGRLARLDRRLTRNHDVRLWTTLILVAVVLGGALLAVATRSEHVARAGVLAAPAMLAVSLLLSAVGATRPGVVAPLLAGLTVAAAVAAGAARRLLPWALVGLLLAYLVVLAAWPEVNSLAALGPRPDGGGRFYGIGNLVETILLTVSVAAAALLPRRLLPAVALLALVTIGWSRAGADGGGVVVLLAAFAVLAARREGARLGGRRAVLAAVAAVGIGAALIGIDAATGGSSHVTRGVERGPGWLAGELAHRVHISAASVGSSWHHATVFSVAVAALAVLGLLRPRFAAGDALLVGIAVSLLVNDSPGDVAAAGALSYAVLWALERVSTTSVSRGRTATVPGNATSVSPRA